MTLDEWAKAHLVVPLPRDFPVWHWTRSPDTIKTLDAAVATGGHLSPYGTGATGHGLYMTTSAVDLMDRGQEVLAATVAQGTRALMVHPELFGVGFHELFELAMERQGWAFRLPSFGKKIDPKTARPAPEVIDGLLDRLDLPCCAYVYGMHLAFMIRGGRCLRLVPELERPKTVADYVKAHPEDRPMLIRYEVVTRWIAERAR